MNHFHNLLFLFSTLALADIYLHNPRGSNNRLNEANTNRNTARLFDSQNNGMKFTIEVDDEVKGGYCYGPAMSYYEGSILTIEFTIVVI